MIKFGLDIGDDTEYMETEELPNLADVTSEEFSHMEEVD